MYISVMKKEEIYLDLSKLSESERKEVFELLPPDKEIDDYLINSCYHYLVKTDNKWFVTSQNYLYKRTGVTFNQFKELFKSTYKKGDIVICLINETEYIVKLNNVKNVSAEKYIVRYSNGIGYSSIYLGGCFDKILRFANEEEINLIEPKEPQLKIGDTFEKDGFICKVKEPIKKWHVVDRGLDAYYIRLSEDEVLWGRADDIRVTEITDEEFIKQLEKHAR